MKIQYVAKQRDVGNEDELCIRTALEDLGHRVQRVHEDHATDVSRLRGDFLLFHKWSDVRALQTVRIPKVFWYFDLVEWPDTSLEGRNDTRRQWMARTVPHIDLGFCTDGDWVAKDTTGKLVQLLQGCSHRSLGLGEPADKIMPIMFSGIQKGGGRDRVSWVTQMQSMYGHMFHHIQNVHGRAMANLVAKCKIVIAPDSPVTDRYCSNRIFLALGYGAFLLHPYSAMLERYYTHEKEVVYYKGRQDMHAKIAYYLSHVEERERIANAGYVRTVKEHTYKHRVEQLLNIVRDRIPSTREEVVQ